ncbi:MAG: F0F1 ATP synthase subunit alpha, partial [Blastochloris sp.]|nr:F0F1 ATP synthase subunit alpha [Blastochloris sp.]
SLYGQIFLETDLFNAGVRPAINTGISVSRVGGDAQTKAMSGVAGRLKIDMAQFRDLAAFAQFASDLDASTRAQLERGQRLQEIFKQLQYQPLSLEDEVALLYAGTNGFIDDVPVSKVGQWKLDFVQFLHTAHPEARKLIWETRLTRGFPQPPVKEALDKALNEFKQMSNYADA